MIYERDLLTIRNGVIWALIGQYISDIIFNIFIYDRKDICEIICRISPIPTYYGAVASGGIAGLSSQYFNIITSRVITTVTYVYVNDFISKKMGITDLISEIDVDDLVKDIIVLVIILEAVDRRSRDTVMLKNTQYNDFYQKTVSNANSNILNLIVVIVGTNLYSIYKYYKENNPEMVESII